MVLAVFVIHPSNIDKGMTKPSQNHRQNNENKANYIDNTARREAQTINKTRKTSQNKSQHNSKTNERTRQTANAS